MAALLQDSLGIEPTLIKGGGGIFQITVEGKVVAKKSSTGFPTGEQVVAAVRAALSK